MSIIQSAGMRFYNSDPANICVIRDAVDRIRPFVDHVFVAVRGNADKTNAIEVLNGLGDTGIHAFNVEPWQDKQFSGPLNGLMFVAGRNYGLTQMLSISPEVVIAQSTLDALVGEYIVGNVMSVGPLLPGHSFDPGEGEQEHEIRGENIPWNQCRLLNLKLYLNGFGFWIGGDSVYDPANAGVEETGTDSENQEKYGAEKARVILIRTRDMVDVVQGHFQPDSKRAAWNDINNPKGKLGSKSSRPAAQMAKVPNLKPGRVLHKIVG